MGKRGREAGGQEGHIIGADDQRGLHALDLVWGTQHPLGLGVEKEGGEADGGGIRYSGLLVAPPGIDAAEMHPLTISRPPPWVGMVGGSVMPYLGGIMGEMGREAHAKDMVDEDHPSSAGGGGEAVCLEALRFSVIRDLEGCSGGAGTSILPKSVKDAARLSYIVICPL